MLVGEHGFVVITYVGYIFRVQWYVLIQIVSIMAMTISSMLISWTTSYDQYEVSTSMTKCQPDEQTLGYV